MRLYFEYGPVIDEVGFGISVNWCEVTQDGRGLYRLGFSFLLWYFNICLEVPA